ncbi:hypothetical protein SAMN02910265_01707 [Ruminococcus flavefaciens]|uniref:Uncharacterized protein n=1 Tax=Ruminococcus flavefaciens TaxID=1265 RepID=A0A1H6JFA2_RUMFL|nr:hypothetical protein [Ruminococcus flavefaciens]SEH60968.1 hypothetical protein SAMN02910265_01707 [Ruminococcus flavefaciens]
MNINDYKKVTDRLEPDERCRKEVLGMNKGENKIKQNINEFDEKVSGVEVKHGHSAMKYISIAAAFVLVAGGIGTTSYFMHRNGGSQFADTVEEETTAEDTETVIEDANEIATEETAPPVDYDYEAIAQELTDKYLESANIMRCGCVDFDANDSITFYTYDSTDDYWSNNYGGQRTFCKVTDDRFHSCQDIYDYYKQNLALTTYDTRFDTDTITPADFKNGIFIEDGCTVMSWLGGDVSKFENGSRVDLSPTHDEECVEETAMAVNNAAYVDYNGEIYVNKNYAERGAKESFTSEPEITEKSADKMVVSRFLKPPYTGYENVKYGEELIFTLIFENDEWKIKSIGHGISLEYYSAIAIQCYLEKIDEYKDIDIDCMDILTSLEVLDYNKETKICKVHAVLHDTQGVDAIDMTADVNVNPNGNLAVISADITRLKEYDSSLDRQGILYAN